jgi:hypothetical protein
MRRSLVSLLVCPLHHDEAVHCMGCNWLFSIDAANQLRSLARCSFRVEAAEAVGSSTVSTKPQLDRAWFCAPPSLPCPSLQSLLCYIVLPMENASPQTLHHIDTTSRFNQPSKKQNHVPVSSLTPPFLRKLSLMGTATAAWCDIA